MTRHTTKRAEECRRKALMYFDRIYNVKETPDYVEVLASIEDDVIIRRYYNDGKEFDI